MNDSPEHVRALHQLPVLRLEHQQRKHPREVCQLLARHVSHQGMQVRHLPKEVRAGLNGEYLASQAHTHIHKHMRGGGMIKRDGGDDRH